jgi:hypothetical protein
MAQDNRAGGQDTLLPMPEGPPSLEKKLAGKCVYSTAQVRKGMCRGAGQRF